jgi:hypothetical protein
MRPVAVTTTYRREELQEKALKVVDRLDELSLEDLQEICE